MKRIVFATFGSLGDLHPYIAIALELKRLGHRPLLATTDIHREAVDSAGVVWVAGGNLVLAGGANGPTAALAGFDPARRTWIAVTGISGYIYALLPLSPTTLLLGGSFTTAAVLDRATGMNASTTVGGLVRLNTSDLALGTVGPLTSATDYGMPGSATINAVVFSAVRMPDGRILIGGVISPTSPTGFGQRFSRMAVLAADESAWLPVGPAYPADGADIFALALALTPSGKVAVGGDFTNVNDPAMQQVASRFAVAAV